MGLTLMQEGKTLCVSGDTYSHRAALRAAGARWDAARRQWRVSASQRAAVEAIIARATQARATQPADQAPGLQIVAGRAQYKGRAYYVAGRRCDGDCVPIVSRDGQRVLLYSRDGSLQFWARLATAATADGAQAVIVKTYGRPMTIASLREYAEQARSFGTDDCRCRCHREPNAGAPGSTLYDGCERCGCEE